MKNIADVEKCVGCFACINACVSKAITISFDKLGNCVPKILNDKCINCGVCKCVCPSANNSVFNRPVACFAASSKTRGSNTGSSSGGVARELYYWSLHKEIVPFGVFFDVNQGAFFRRIYSAKDVELTKGSKYVFASTESVYSEIKNLIRSGENCLFIGTPCQVDGLRFFLNGKCDNVFLIDLVCHGTPPFIYLKQYLSSFGSIDSCSFRGDDGYNLKLISNGEIKYSKNAEYDPYFKAFLSGIILRPSCYECKYARGERVSDLTIGDFHGLNNSVFPGNNSNVSIVLINSQKGEKLFSEISHSLFTKEMPVDESQKNNEPFNHPAQCTQDRMLFERAFIKTQSFLKSVKKTRVYKHMVFHKILYPLKKIIKN